MNRRNFLAATTAAGALTLTEVTAATVNEETDTQQFIELIKIHQFTGPKKQIMPDFYNDVAIPALNRIGIGPIGLFTALHGPNAPTLWVLIPHPSIESFLTKYDRLMADATFLKDGEKVINAPFSDPAYIREEISLMKAFKNMPKVEAPQNLLNKNSRIFEMRIYESHNRQKNKLKIQMFIEGREIEIFRKTGLQPVFFGEMLVGQQMPNLTYLLVFENMVAREKNWEAFRNHPDWLKLRDDKTYADTVSNITDLILRPVPGSQI